MPEHIAHIISFPLQQQTNKQKLTKGAIQKSLSFEIYKLHQKYILKKTGYKNKTENNIEKCNQITSPEIPDRRTTSDTPGLLLVA